MKEAKTAARKARLAAAKKTFGKLLRRREASQYLREVHGIQYAPDTLAGFACEGTGPEMVYINDIPFYRPTALDVWAKAKMSKPTTQGQKYARPRDPQLKPKRKSPSPASTEPPVVAA
jgi:hypothetical protein